MTKKDKKRFENFMTLDLIKGPSGSVHWISRILDDDELTYEALGVLLVLGEKLQGSTFDIQTVIESKVVEDISSLINTLCFLQVCEYVQMTIHRQNWTVDDLKDYWAYVVKSNE